MLGNDWLLIVIDHLDIDEEGLASMDISGKKCFGNTWCLWTVMIPKCD